MFERDYDGKPAKGIYRMNSTINVRSGGDF